MSVHCCNQMDYQVNQQCQEHTNRADCPDALISFSQSGYGLIIHDGGSSVVGINFCPWCGAEISKTGKSSDTQI
jgi:hypothetical protein